MAKRIVSQHLLQRGRHWQVCNGTFRFGLANFACAVVARLVHANGSVGKVQVVDGEREDFPGAHPREPGNCKERLEGLLGSCDYVRGLCASEKPDRIFSLCGPKLQVREAAFKRGFSATLSSEELNRASLQA